MKQEVAEGIVRHEDIDEAVVIVIRERDPHPFSHMFEYAGRFGNIRKRSIAIVVKQQVGQPHVAVGRAIGREAVGRTGRLLAHGPLQVIDHNQIQPAIVVVIEPSRRSRECVS